MRILIYAPAARMGGARAHLLGLVPELAAIAPEDEVLLLGQPDLVADLPPLPRTWSLRVERAQSRGFLGRLAWEQRTLPRIAEHWGADVLLSFGSFVPLWSACPTVLEAGNALYFSRPYWDLLRTEPPRVQLQEYARWILLKASLKAAGRVLAPTRAMRQDVATRLPEIAERIDVALWGVADIFHQRRWSQASGATVLGISKHGINKEFDVLVRAVAQLPPTTRLVLTGTPEESRWSRRTAALVSELGLEERVCFLGDVPNARVPDEISAARVVAFPTWCESFGLPVAEALAMGAPTIAGDIPACREVGGDAACFYQPGDASALAGAIANVIEDAGDLPERAYERGKTFRWRDNAVLVRQSLERAVRGRG